MSVVYVFKISSKHRKSIWRKIAILESQSLGEFDKSIRDAFNYDQYDHLSEFYRGKVWSSSGFGEIEPGGSGKGSSRKIRDLKLKIGDKLEYVYDFGDSLINFVELIEFNAEVDGNFPQVIEKNKPQYSYCENCSSKDKKEIARFNVYYLEDDSVEQLCESCTDEVSEEEVDISEILY